ncbi:MAG: Flp pilus assembly complex ATPase component TadA [Cyanobacteria bacterium RUI128]|nr:Flp pilus assembly complex ATPase component TadA [Cyanobacteria bacterium RUI128]
METITNKTLEKLKYELVRDGLIEYDVLDKAQKLAMAEGINIGQALITSNILDEATLLKFLEKKLHIPYVNLEDYSLDPKCLDYISFADARKYNVIPLFKIEDVLTVAMADPLDLFVIDKIIETAECSIEPVISSEASIVSKIDEYYNTPATVDKIYTSAKDSDFNWTDELHSEDLSEEHIQKIIRAILKQAIIEDVHELYFEQSDSGLNLIFKKYGNYESRGSIPYILVSSFVSKLKMLSNLDPSVCEVPQLGKLCFKVDEITLIASISAFPTIIGERIALKIYKPPVELNAIITDDRQRQLLTKAIETPGIVLVCGAQLSGKTHVIYSLLIESAKYSNNIMTIESISKYDLKKVHQCELNENVGFNLDKALRFIEFQSPDIVYIEGVKSKQAFDYFSELVYNDKTVITEFLANNMTDLREKLSFPDFQSFKSLISCMVFIHSKDSIEVFDKEKVQKYLA